MSQIFSRGLFVINCDPLLLCVFSCVAVGAMLSRGTRTGCYDLPGAESTAVPLTGYRPLSCDNSSLTDQLGRESGNNKLKPAQVNYHLVLLSLCCLLGFLYFLCLLCLDSSCILLFLLFKCFHLAVCTLIIPQLSLSFQFWVNCSSSSHFYIWEVV